MHSGFLVLLWLVLAAGLQLIPLSGLTAVLVLSVFAAWRWAPRRAARLLRRVRILLAAICLFFGGFTPGEAVWIDWPNWSPTREGLLLAAEHAGRLVTVVLWVALLLEHLSTERLVGGLYALLRPLAVLGLPAERLAVRLLLVLRYVESAPAGAWRRWLEWPAETADDGDERIRIARELLGWRELMVTMALAAAGTGVWLMAGGRP